MVPAVRIPAAVTAMTFALLVDLPAPPVAASPALSQADPEEVSPAVVLRYRDLACRSFASVSTGDRTVAALAITEDGLLLVPAHLLSLATGVRVRASRTNDGVIDGSSDSVAVVGIHPRLDLALVQARMPDPRLRFHPVDFAKNRIATGDRVYLSHPFQAVPRKRLALTTTVGDRDGNFRLDPRGRDETRDLGWFVFDEEARAVGLVSWVLEDGEVVARALSLAGLRREEFLPAAKYRCVPERKALLIRMAEKLLQRPAQGFRDPLDDARAQFLIERALVNDPGDIDTYLRLERRVATQRMRSALLTRAISCDPWSGRVKGAYADLAEEFARSSQTADAVAVWLEMTAKYPAESSPGWTALARYHASETKYPEAAFEARMAIHARSDQREEMDRLYRSSLDHLDAAQKGLIEAKVREIERLSDQARAEAEKSRAAGKRFMTAGAEKLFDPLPPADSPPQATPSPRRSAPPGPLRPSEGDSTPAYVAARIRVATEYLKAGQWETAARILEDVTRECPRDPRSDEARRLLAELFGR